LIDHCPRIIVTGSRHSVCRPGSCRYSDGTPAYVCRSKQGIPVVPGRRDAAGRASTLATERHEQMNRNQSTRSKSSLTRTGLVIVAATLFVAGCKSSAVIQPPSSGIPSPPSGGMPSPPSGGSSGGGSQGGKAAVNRAAASRVAVHPAAARRAAARRAAARPAVVRKAAVNKVVASRAVVRPVAARHRAQEHQAVAPVSPEAWAACHRSSSRCRAECPG